MKINYPIKYAAMPIIEQIGWSYGLNELEREYDVVCYIVSKCYLISDLIKYKKDGSITREYGVVFPYQLSDFSKWKTVFPEYNIYGQCTNSIIVDKTFDSYEDAMQYVERKNEKLCENTYKYLPLSKDQILEKKDEFNTKLEEYKVLEEQILLNTNDMKIGEIKKLNNVIKIENNHRKILQCSLYEALKLFRDEKFVVYNVSDKQYNDLVKLIDKGNDEFNYLISKEQCMLIHKEKDDLIKLPNTAYYIKSNRINCDNKMAKVTNDNLENIDEDALVFYTTETIEDLLNSYKEHLEIDLKEFEGPVLKKVKNN